MRTSRALNWENKKKLSCFIQQVHQSNKDTSCFLFTVSAIQAFLAQEKPRLHFWFQSILCSSVEKLKIKSMFDSTIEFWLMNCIYIVLLFISACTNTMSAKSGPTTDAALFTSWFSFVERLVAIVINKPRDKIITKKRDFSHFEKQLRAESSQQLLN